MKLPLKRFNSFGNVVTTKNQQTFNGNYIKKTITKFSFSFCYLHDTVSNLLSDAGTHSNQNKLIASLDPRFRDYVNDTGSDQIQIDGIGYRISNVAIDDSNPLRPLYEVTITNQGSNNNSGSGSSDSSGSNSHHSSFDDGDDDSSGGDGW